MLTFLNSHSFLSIIQSNFLLLFLLVIILALTVLSIYLKKTTVKLGLILISSILIFGLFFIPNYNIRINKIGSTIAAIPTLSFVEPDKKQTSLNEEVAKAYGVDAFSKVQKMDYTFNVEFGGKKISRKWEWNPKTKEITYWGKDKNGKEVTLTYNRNDKMDEKTKKIDAAFINDNYWLLFPFHLVWDTNVKFTDEGMKKYPIGNGEGRCLAVQYSNKVGYTPGDQFDLYLNKNNMIHEWIYLHGGSKKNPRPATWEGNKTYGGFTISTMHKGPGKTFKLWFSDVKVDFAK
jgi:hypothetical protein